MWHKLMPWLSGSLELIFPRECLVCTRPLRGASLCFRCIPRSPSHEELVGARCLHCFSQISSGESDTCATCSLYPLAMERSRYLWEYGGVARDYIRTMKYRPSVLLARQSGELLGTYLTTLFPRSSWDLIVPVPGSQQNFRRRLFHPCTEIARSLARYTHGARLSPCLSRNTRRRSQVSLSHEARLTGMRRMFTVPARYNLTGARVLLVEDVITTGATSAAATLALRRAGAMHVDLLALAQTSVWSRFRRRIAESIDLTEASEDMHIPSPLA